MSNIKRTNTKHSLRAVALAVLSIGFAATVSFPAAAHVAAHAPRSTWHQTGDFYFNQPASIQRGVAPDSYPPADSHSYPPPDYCDLPSAGCESYLSN